MDQDNQLTITFTQGIVIAIEPIDGINIFGLVLHRVDPPDVLQADCFSFQLLLHPVFGFDFLPIVIIKNEPRLNFSDLPWRPFERFHIWLEAVVIWILHFVDDLKLNIFDMERPGCDEQLSIFALQQLQFLPLPHIRECIVAVIMLTVVPICPIFLQPCQHPDHLLSGVDDIGGVFLPIEQVVGQGQSES